MREHNPEDRVRVKNIINIDEDDIQTFWITRMRKQQQVDSNGTITTRDVPYEKEIQWNFKDGFFFAWGGKYYKLNPGEEKTYTRFLADHCAKHMAEYIIDRQYKATKRPHEDGTFRYDNNILNDPIRKKKIINQIILGVEEWFEGDDEDFDTILAKKYGGDFDESANETFDPNDTELPEVVQGDDELVAPKAKKAVAPTSDSDLADIRQEADQLGIEYTAADTVATLKSRILKQMA